MKRLALAFALIFSLTLVTAPTDADAQTVFELGPRIGIDVGDVEEVFIGADFRITSPGLPIVINPTFDFYFVEDITVWNLSGNALFQFGIDNEVFNPYAGAGLAIFRQSFDEQTVDTGFGTVTSPGGSTTDIGINLIFGADFITGGPVKPFAEVHFTPVFSDPESINLFGVRGGILFGF